MGDLFSKNRMLFIKRYEHQKLVALSNIQAREIRIMELQEEIERCQVDMDAQRKVIAEMDLNIKLQHEEAEKERKAAEAEKK
jgi:hypothetical protein